MKRTNKLKALILKELDELKALLPLEVRKATLVWENYNPQSPQSCIYGLITSESDTPISNWIKNFVATPYTSVCDEYTRSRKKHFEYDNTLYSPLEFYMYNLEEDDKTHAQIFAYLLEETNKISL